MLPGRASSRSSTSARAKIFPESGVPELANSLDLIYVEDRNTLDGAFKDLVRARFREWVASGAEGAEQPRAIGHWVPFKSLQYEYLVHVDEGSLRSVVYEALQPLDYDLESVSYVNFVDASWPPYDDDIEDLDGDEELFEPIEGCHAENVGWMKITTDVMGPCGF